MITITEIVIYDSTKKLSIEIDHRFVNIQVIKTNLNRFRYSIKNEFKDSVNVDLIYKENGNTGNN